MNPPSDWVEVPLERVADVRTGLSKNAARKGSTVTRPYLRVANVQDGFLDLSEIKTIDVPAAQLERYALKIGDLLLIEGNGNPENLGRGCVWQGQIAGCVHQNHIFSVRVRPAGGILPSFLALQLQSDRGREYLLSCAKSSTGLATLNTTQLRKLRVSFPPIDEQARISVLLACWDSAAEATRRLIATRTKRLDALTHQLMTSRKRLASQPSPWSTVRADRLFVSVARKGQEGDRLLSVTQEKGVVPRDTLEGRVTMPSAGTTTFKLVEPGDFVISLRSFQGGVEHSAYRGLVSPAYTVLRPTDSVEGRYFRHYFRSADFIKRLSVAVVGIRDGKQVSFQDFRSIKILYPSIGEQAAIANVLDTAEAEIALLLRQLSAITIEKRGLMQLLLTGKGRLPVKEAAAI